MILSTKAIKSHITYLTVYLSINIHAQFFSFHRKLMPIVSINIFVKKILFTQRKRKKDINCNLDWYLPTPYIYLYFISFLICNFAQITISFVAKSWYCCNWQRKLSFFDIRQILMIYNFEGMIIMLKKNVKTNCHLTWFLCVWLLGHYFHSFLMKANEIFMTY